MGSEGQWAPLRHPTSVLHFPTSLCLGPSAFSPEAFQGRTAPARHCPALPRTVQHCLSLTVTACTCSQRSVAAARPLVAIWGGSANHKRMRRRVLRLGNSCASRCTEISALENQQQEVNQEVQTSKVHLELVLRGLYKWPNKSWYLPMAEQSLRASENLFWRNIRVRGRACNRILTLKRRLKGHTYSKTPIWFKSLYV